MWDPMAVIQKMAVAVSVETLVPICQTIQCHLLPRRWRRHVPPKRRYLSIKLFSVIYPEERGNRYHRNVGTYLPNYTVSSSTQKMEATGSTETLVQSRVSWYAWRNNGFYFGWLDLLALRLQIILITLITELSLIYTVYSSPLQAHLDSQFPLVVS
jgi:hypothetical protein